MTREQIILALLILAVIVVYELRRINKRRLLFRKLTAGYIYKKRMGWHFIKVYNEKEENAIIDWEGNVVAPFSSKDFYRKVVMQYLFEGSSCYIVENFEGMRAAFYKAKNVSGWSQNVWFDSGFVVKFSQSDTHPDYYIVTSLSGQVLYSDERSPVLCSGYCFGRTGMFDSDGKKVIDAVCERRGKTARIYRLMTGCLWIVVDAFTGKQTVVNGYRMINRKIVAYSKSSVWYLLGDNMKVIRELHVRDESIKDVIEGYCIYEEDGVYKVAGKKKKDIFTSKLPLIFVKNRKDCLFAEVDGREYVYYNKRGKKIKKFKFI